MSRGAGKPSLANKNHRANISPDVGRKHRDTAEQALATATPDELLMLLFATQADCRIAALRRGAARRVRGVPEYVVPLPKPQ